MNAQVDTQAAVKSKAAYLVKRDSRTRYSFGKVWNAMIAGLTDVAKVPDMDKLVAQGVKLKVARSRSDVKKLSKATLLARVQKALAADTAAA